MDVRFVEIDQKMPIALRAREQILNPLDEGLPSRRIGPAEQLLGLLPRQIQAVQSGPDRLATTDDAEALARPADQALECPARRRIGARYRRRCRRALGGADDVAEFSFAVRTKRGRRPPVRR
jgi:hypothetical protein